MSNLVALAGKTTAMAHSAVHLYFEPLSLLIDAAAGPATGVQVPSRAMLALPSSGPFWRAVERSREQLRDARLSRQATQIDATLADLATRLEELHHLRRSVDAEYREMAARWSSHRWSSHMDPEAGVTGTFHYQTSMSSSLKGAAWLLVVLTAIVETALGVLVLDLSIRTAVPIAVIIALAMFSAAGAVADIAILGKHERDRTVTRDALVRQLLLWGGACFAVSAALLFARTTELVAPAVGPLLAALGLVTPVLAGLLQTGSRLMGWSRELTSRSEELAEIQSILEALRVEALGLRDQGAPRPDHQFERPTRRITFDE